MTSILVGRKAPNFIATAVLGNGEIKNEFELSEQTKEKYVVLFFYPLNFTFVCPSELIALNNRIQEFKNRETEVIAISVDSQFSHHQWRNTPVDQGGIGPVNFTLVSDLSNSICRSYGVLHPEMSVGLRASFLLDQDGIVRSQTINDLPLGRNIDEQIRVIDALQFHEKHGEVCPAGWNKGDQGMIATEEGVSSYLEVNSSNL